MDGLLPFGPGIYQWREGCLVRLDEAFRKCAVLIGTASVGTRDGISPWGTAFLVHFDFQDPKSSYLVTAWHVIEGKGDAPFDVRFNKHGGGAENYHVDEPEWFTHPTDNTVDVAVHEIEIPEWADCTFIPRAPTILEADRFASKDIGAGNRTYTVGLWRFLHGDKRNQPFVFTGHIGLVPDGQKVPVKGWLPEHGKDGTVDVDAYLVEGEPLDGSSGSPVFVRRTLGPFAFSKSGKAQGYVEGSIWLLGLQSDAWFGKPAKSYQIRDANDTIVVPRGVNVVVPSMKINEVLDHPMLKDRREKKKVSLKSSFAPRKTSRAEKPSSDAESENPQHRGDFKRLLGAAVKQPKSSD